MTNVTSTDQIRNLTNKVHLAGYLSELEEVKRGVDKNGVPYISFRGKIQCSEDKADTYTFRTYVPAKKKDGSDSKLFETVNKWAASAVPMTKNMENPTMLELTGSIVDNPYVSKDTQKLVEAIQFNTNLFGEFKEFKHYIELEGFIHGATEETAGEDKVPTGRMVLSMLSRDIFHNTLDIKKIFIPAETLKAMDVAGVSYERGCTAKLNISLESTQVEGQVKQETGSWGVQYATTSYSRNEWILVGGDPPLYEDESDNALSRKVMAAAFNERKAHLTEVENEGKKRLEEAAKSSSAPTGFTSAATSQSANTTVEDDDDDFPF